MKKNSFTYLLIILIMTLYILTIGSGYRLNDKKEISIPMWILGEWEGSTEIANATGTYNTKVKIDFINSNRLLLYASDFPEGGEELLFGIPYRYEFVSANEIVLISRSGSRWQLDKDKDRLNISIMDQTIFSQNLSLTRIPRINRLFVIFAGILTILTISSKWPYGPNFKNEPEEYQANRLGKLSTKLVFLMLELSIFSAGILFNLSIFSQFTKWHYFLYLGMPWGAYFILEVFLIMFVVGLRIYIRSNKKIKGLLTSSTGIWQLFAIFLMSSGVCGILAGLAIWINFLFTSCTYTGICFFY